MGEVNENIMNGTDGSCVDGHRDGVKCQSLGIIGGRRLPHFWLVGFDKIGFMLALLLVLMVWSGITPADRTVWMVESVWSTGLLAILMVTRRWFKFSTAAYLCFWVWAVLQTIGAHYTFEHVPMDWLMSPLGQT